jgi:Na+-transporting methylmalonyl-CoA/oxaloacetate decarboxylase gamma subunit
MNENLNAALQITVVGMSFVLAVLALLWLVMVVLVRVTADPVTVEAAPALAAPSVIAPASRAVRQRAAAVAVAVAIALARPIPPVSAERRPQLSPWQAVRRVQLLNQRDQRR